MPQKMRARAAANSATPASKVVNPSLCHEDLQLWAAPEDRVALLRQKLTRCSICGDPPYFHNYYQPTDDEHRRWHVGWVGYALCFRCFADPEWAQPQLLKRFEFFCGSEGPIQ